MNPTTAVFTFGLCIFVLFGAAGAGAQQVEEEPVEVYTLGDQTLSINAGLFVPLFFHSLSQTPAIQASRLSLGGVGSLNWNSYLNNDIRVGAELAGTFSFSPNGWALLMVNLAAKGTYILRMFPFEVPLSLGVGVNFTRFKELFHVEPILKPGASFYWTYNSEWSFGGNLTYWWIPQIVFGDRYEGQSGFGNFLEFTLSALYHFR